MQIKGKIAMSMQFNLTILAGKREKEGETELEWEGCGYGERIKGVLLFIRLYYIFFRSHDHQNIPCNMFIAYFILVPTSNIEV